jgi:hypothetical protein
LVLRRVTANLIENVHGEPGLGLVLVGNPVDCSNGVLLATPGKQELGGLVEMEQEEAADKHENGQGAHGEHEVSPAHIVVLSAARDSVADFVAGRQAIRAAISRNEAPGDKTNRLLDDPISLHNSQFGQHQPSDNLTHRPPYAQHGQEISGGKRQEFQEKGSIDRQITADTEAQAGEQSTDTEFEVY